VAFPVSGEFSDSPFPPQFKRGFALCRSTTAVPLRESNRPMLLNAGPLHLRERVTGRPVPLLPARDPSFLYKNTYYKWAIPWGHTGFELKTARAKGQKGA